MQDISLHLLDILENSVRAGARNIKVRVINNVLKNRLRIIVEDDGSGMDAHTLEKAQDPFYTSKEERVKKVGLGIPLFKQNAEIVGGSFKMASEPGFGTVLTVDFPLDHIDRMPLGNLKDTLLGGIIGHPEVDFFIHFLYKDKAKELCFHFDTKAIREELGDIPLTYPDVIEYIDQSLYEGIQNTNMEDV
ncbi:MAG: ATP-binding protein [Candidatus Cloacimonadales bacterium]|mgnify:CR=1 FL=1|jgi:anti-sigma regulatory factor (Ser/Thr protein kinase)|nr:ATP-binding protein [Candidatus Cloacimonadota bacterium]MDY0381150.1 ATP-binding protein [Candidatus Cloacimonadaceae bacterium]HCM14625.1 ATP-binding protein [Candidatus Cloacimonas sp.]MCB5256031.1 ATP-binding protein [Candidatus Cloacimonadota bacterium]MCB5263287.1 ATP-binding protein [Candidatus Cloacimonadota bacterium]